MGRLWAIVLGCLLGMLVLALLLRGCEAGADSRVAVLKPLPTSAGKAVAPSPAPKASETGASARTEPSKPARQRKDMLAGDREYQRKLTSTTVKTPVVTSGTASSGRGAGTSPTQRERTTNAILPRPIARRPGGVSGGVPGAVVMPGAVAQSGGAQVAAAAAMLAQQQAFLPSGSSFSPGGSSASALGAPMGSQAGPGGAPGGEGGSGSASGAGSSSEAVSIPTSASGGSGFSVVTGLPQSNNNSGGSTTIGAFDLGSPGAGATSVSVTPTFTWSVATGATAYRLRVSTSADFATTVIDQSGLTNPSFSAGVGALQEGATYFWMVAASNTAGTRDSTTTRSFTTLAPGPGAPGAPGSFALTSPANNARGLTGDVVLTWANSSSAATYNVVVSPNADLSGPIASGSALTTRQFTVSAGLMQTGRDYFWRVTATNATGTTTGNPAPARFTRLGPPGAFALVSPANNALNQVLPLNLAWGASADAATYRLEVARDAGFTQPVVNRSGITTTSALMTSADLQTGNTYFWRVTASNAIDSRGSSNVFSFSLRAAPGDFALVSPANNAAIGLPVTLDWEDSPSAILYTVQVSESATFTTNVVNELVVPLLSGTAYTVPDGRLTLGRTYFWRVIAQNEAGQKFAVVSPFRFTTGVADYDVNRDGRVDVLDMYAYEGLTTRTDLNGDGVINDSDRLGLRGVVRGNEPGDLLVRN